MAENSDSPQKKDVEEPQAEENLVDPQTTLRSKCDESKCQATRLRYEQCNERVSQKTETTETCAEELVDFFSCVDHCVAKTLFNELK